MKYDWQDLPKPLNCFTVRNAIMVNLNNGRVVSNYAANTKIVVVQKCVTPKGTYYRTQEAAHHCLNYAFRASAFGLPDEKAPSVPSVDTLNSLSSKKCSKPRNNTPASAKDITCSPQESLPKGGGAKLKGWLKKFFSRNR